MNKETHGPWPSGHHEQGEAIGALTSLPRSLPLCILKTQQPLRCPWTNTPELHASSTFLKTEMRVPKNVSVIPALDLFNMPITLRSRGRERPGAAEDSARGHKNHSYTKCNRMAQLCPRPTLEEACHHPCVTTSDLKAACRNGEWDSGQPARLQLPVSCAGEALKRLLW